jgi:putative Mg2+ transporter-C (MgtC) family protein
MLSESEIAIILRALLATFLGSIIGFERRAAGVPVRGRIITMTTMTAAALTAVGAEYYPMHVSRIAAGVVTGIGFLGAGAILRTATGEVHGQATAAGIWTMSCIGIIVGAGQEVVGILLTAMVYLILAWDEWPVVSQMKQRWAKRPTNDAESKGSGEPEEPTD